MSALVALSFLAAAPAFAEKPDWAGEGKPAKEHRKAMDSKTDDEVEEMKEKGKAESEKRGKKARDLGEKAEEELEEGEGLAGEELEEAHKKMKGAGHEIETMEKRGLEKQREKKAEQVQKELDKGSETGQEARQKRKKWLSFRSPRLFLVRMTVTGRVRNGSAFFLSTSCGRLVRVCA
jgi:hypothetical protein